MAFAVINHPGSAATARAVCNSIGGVFDGASDSLCGGSIFYLTHDRRYALRATTEAIHDYGYWRLYRIRGFLAVLPALLLFLQLHQRTLPRRWQLSKVAFGAAISGIASLAIFASGMDWGRWIYIHVSCVLLLLLSIDKDPDSGRQKLAINARNAAAWVALAAYSVVWTLPSLGNTPYRFGYRDVLRYTRLAQ